MLVSTHIGYFFFFLMIRGPPRSSQSRSSAASDVYKRQHTEVTMAIDVTRLWVFRFVTLWFCENILHMGVRSVWYSVVISNCLLYTSDAADDLLCVDLEGPRINKKKKIKMCTPLWTA